MSKIFEDVVESDWLAKFPFVEFDVKDANDQDGQSGKKDIIGIRSALDDTRDDREL